MKILLTGSSGFLGAVLAAELKAAGHQLVLPGRRPVATAGGEEHPVIAAIEAMSIDEWLPLLKGCDSVVHSAAIAHIGVGCSEADYMAINARAAGRLAEAARKAGCQRFVFISSIRAQVGATSPEVQTETSPEAPTEPYGRSKLQGERLVFRVFPKATIFRPALIVGAEPKANLSLLARVAGLPVPLPFGSFQQRQAFVSLPSIVSAVKLALASPAMQGEIFVLADQPAPSLADMIGWIREGQGRSRWLFPVPQQLLRLPFALIGKGEYFNRLVSGLDVDATKLRKSGWQQAQAPADTFRALGREAARIRRP
jgi:nucleoside-diphosphate-sugar epimerase